MCSLLNSATFSHFLGGHHYQRCGLGCSNGGLGQATRRHTRRQPVDGQARERGDVFYRLRALRHIRPAITASDANTCSVVGSRLDYAYAVLYGISTKNTNRLQRIQNALARCVVDPKVHRGSKALLHQLYTGCLSVILLTSNLRSSHSLLVHLPPVCTVVPQLISLWFARVSRRCADRF